MPEENNKCPECVEGYVQDAGFAECKACMPQFPRTDAALQRKVGESVFAHIVRRRESIRKMEAELQSWLKLSDVSINITPGDNGAIEIPPTPDSIRQHIAYLQEEWDGAERRRKDAEEEARRGRENWYNYVDPIMSYFAAQPDYAPVAGEGIGAVLKSHTELLDARLARAERAESAAEVALFATFDECLNRRPHLLLEIGYNRQVDWMVHVYDATGVGIKESELIISTQDREQSAAMQKATDQLKERFLKEAMPLGAVFPRAVADAEEQFLREGVTLSLTPGEMTPGPVETFASGTVVSIAGKDPHVDESVS